MKENRRVSATKRMLREGLLRLLRTQPIDEIRVTELCEESGVNRATFYRHFNQPRDVLEELRATILQELQVSVRRNVKPGVPKSGLEAICRYCYDHAETLRILFICHSDDGFVQLLDQFYQENLSGFRAVGEELRIDPDSMRLISSYYGGGIYFILHQWLMGNTTKSPEEMADLIYALITARRTLPL